MAGRNEYLYRVMYDGSFIEGTLSELATVFGIPKTTLQSAYYRFNAYHKHPIVEVGYIKRIPIFRVLCCGVVVFDGTPEEISNKFHYCIGTIQNQKCFGMYTAERIDTKFEKIYYE